MRTLAPFFLLAVGCTAQQTQKPTIPEPADMGRNAPTAQVIAADASAYNVAAPAATHTADMGAADFGTSLEESGGDGGAPPAPVGRLCIKGPGTYERVGKGTASPEEPGTPGWRVNAGLIFQADGKEVTVRARQGGVIEGLALEQTHRVGVRFVSGGKQQGFRLRFKDGLSEMCAYYNPMYDNWRLRPVGRRGCGPCPAQG